MNNFYVGDFNLVDTRYDNEIPEDSNVEQNKLDGTYYPVIRDGRCVGYSNVSDHD